MEQARRERDRERKREKERRGSWNLRTNKETGLFVFGLSCVSRVFDFMPNRHWALAVLFRPQ